ncbi:DUF1631 family protein [Undibacterium sp. RTI2.1]|uniref:DUF1631 family protein n=1 Tax=unclassified Undibacterium TaxID=2630295 RepID=UPI002AB5B0C7|nr:MULTISPECIES: DUF1631 family protein [unclassified Undibacterium]MDY7539112.1 DUF1631 family protein [Undibacterium sp. 5I1]MEB0030962.1 DUF1631 family protein [Undibacterium sp. RTI2.1]MEB0115809.1 DUF1631 family protein [Undibacterium sp. RTI2.2]MEB0229753.1 DUF1631 family protein [Undibacterium sp. 10I3]MEB0259278.1 DUF1631 family protein [Undibacterium sp. 5I1]
MSAQSPDHRQSQKAPLARADILRALIPHATHLVVAQLDAFAARLANAFFAASEQVGDAREANLNFNSGQLLKNNGYAFYYLCSADIQAAFRKEIQALSSISSANSLPTKPQSERVEQQDIALTLVSYEEMDKKLAFGRASRSLELSSAEQLAALSMRLACIIGIDSLSITQNPFRPEFFLRVVHASWCKFNPDTNTHPLILPLLRGDILFDLSPIFQALNEFLVYQGILPDLHESYRIKKTENPGSSQFGKKDFSQKLKQIFSEKTPSETSSNDANDQQKICQTGRQRDQQQHDQQFSASGQSKQQETDTRLFHYLENLQKTMAIHQLVAGAQDVIRLSQMREQMPELASGNSVEKTTLDLLSKIFDTVFHNPSIPSQIKELIGVLQIPVLKAALIDKEFFFQDTHPARRMIDLLTQQSVAWDQSKGHADPLFQAMQRNVSRVQNEFDQQMSLFDEVVSDLENFVAKEDESNTQALQEPIKRALQKEKFKQANIVANNEVALRVGTGEVVAFVESFLENRWTKVLTLAYSVQEDKPHAVTDAIKTMDDLIWSVKPKITLPQRQELLNRLPAILARLNKWLSLIKWEDADRIQFFADLAECHASIVRSPLELSPEKQLEIAVEAAQIAAERRLEKRAQAEAQELEKQHAEDDYVDVAADETADVVANLERGIWLQFTKKNGDSHKARLAWVSPMRSLYIFTTSQKEKSFSLAVKELEQTFREQRAEILMLDKLVDRALSEALEEHAEQEIESTN